MKIFISSPGDVKTERRIAHRILQKLADQYAMFEPFEIFLSELHPSQSVPIPIQQQLPRPEGFDLFVCIVWTRMGTPLPDRIETAGGVIEIVGPRGETGMTGTEFEFAWAMEGWKKNNHPQLMVYRKKAPAGDVPQSAAEVELLAGQLRRIEAFEQQFKAEDGTYISARHSFLSDVEFEELFEVHVRQLVKDRLKEKGHDASAVDGAKPPAVWIDRCPFRGLARFEFEHSPVFFGRDRVIRELIRRMELRYDAGCGFLLVLGGSGAGKSSLVRAGVISSLVQRAIAGTDAPVLQWRVAIASLDEPGGPAMIVARALLQQAAATSPDAAVRPQALSAARTGPLADSSQFAGKILDDPGFAACEVRARLVSLSETLRADKRNPSNAEARLLLFVDQFEQLFADQVPLRERTQVIHFLKSLSTNGQVQVVAAMRSDYYGKFQEHETLMQMRGNDGQFDVTPPGPSDIERILRDAAVAAGLTFESESAERDLADMLVEETRTQPNSLPLLSMCLERLYLEDCLAAGELASGSGLDAIHQRRSSELTLASHRRLGGIHGAVASVAASLQRELNELELAAHKAVFWELVQLSDASDRPRSRVMRLAVFQGNDARQSFVRRCAAHRLLSVYDQSDGKLTWAVVGLTHEALFESWPLLKSWVDEYRQLLSIRARIEQGQTRWQRAHDSSLLIPPGLPLEEARQLVIQAAEFLSPETTAYITASITHDEAQKSRTARRRRIMTCSLSALTLLAVTGGFVAWLQRENAVARTREARANLDLAENAKAKATASEADAKASENEAKEHLQDAQRTLAQVHFERGLANEREFQGRNSLAEYFLAANTIPRDPEDTPLVNAYQKILFDRLTRSSALIAPPLADDDAAIVAFSPDGTRLLTRSGRTARLWDARTGAMLGAAMRHDDQILSAAFSPDGLRVVTGSGDQTARLWDAHTGMPLGDVMSHGDHVTSVAFSPDGLRLVTRMLYKRPRLWDGKTGTPVGTDMEHTGIVWSAAFSPDSSQLVTCEDDIARLWDTRTGMPVAVIQDADIGREVAFSPDGARIMTTSGDTARLWDAHSGMALGAVMRHDDYVCGLAVSPDGLRLATGSNDQTARLWDALTGQSLGAVMRHDGTVRSAKFSPDGSLLATVSGDSSDTVRLWDGSTGAPVGAVMKHAGYVSTVDFTPDGSRLVTNDKDHHVRVWDAGTGVQLEVAMTLSDEAHVVISPDGSRLAIGVVNGRPRLRDADAGLPIGGAMRHNHPVRTVAFSPDGTRVLTRSDDTRERVWDAHAGTPIEAVTHDDPEVWCVAFSPDGSRVVKRAHRVASLWDTRTRMPIGEAMEHADFIGDVAFSPDGLRVATGSTDHTARLWDAQTGLPIGVIMQHEASVRSLAFSPDGSRLLTVSYLWDNRPTVQVWDATAGAPVGEVMKHDHALNCVAFSPDGSRLVTGSQDNTARLWDAATGTAIGAVMKHDDFVLCAAFSPDGSRLATGSADTAQLWDARTGIQVGTFMKYEGCRVWGLAFSPDGTSAVTAHGDTARLWDVATGTPTPIGSVMKHDSAVTSVAFSPDGTRLVTGSGDTARLWDVSSVPIHDLSRERMQVLFELLSGCRWAADHPSKLAPIPADELMQLRQKLSDDPILRFLRERPARRALGRALSQAQLAEGRNNWFAAEFHLRKLSQMQPDGAAVWRRLGHALAQQRKWAEAANAFQSEVRLEPGNLAAGPYNLALAWLAAGDQEQFRAAAESLLSVAEKSDKASDWDLAPWLSALSQIDNKSAVRLIPLSRRAVEANPGNWAYWETLGAINFRAGVHGADVVDLHRALALHSEIHSPKSADSPAADAAADAQPSQLVGGTVWTQAFLALAHHAAFHPDEAHRHRQLAEQLAKDSPSSDWREQLRRELLLRELAEIPGPPANN